MIVVLLKTLVDISRSSYKHVSDMLTNILFPQNFLLYQQVRHVASKGYLIDFIMFLQNALGNSEQKFVDHQQV